jgi:hypothetical protein
MYDTITEEIEAAIGEYHYNGAEFRRSLTEWQRENVKEWRNWLDFVLERRCKTELTWRQVKVIPQKYKSCEVCGRMFYDLSRNGRTTVCHYVTYKRWNQKHREYRHRYKHDRLMSECEVVRDDAMKQSGQVDGQATNYTAKTRERLERQMFVWTSFDSDGAFVRKLELEVNHQYAMNGRYKSGMVNFDEWAKGGEVKYDTWVAFEAKSDKITESVSKFNVYDLEWSEVVARGLDRYFDRKTFEEKHLLEIVT